MTVRNTIIKIVNIIPFAGRLTNRLLTNKICCVTHPRPRPFSLWSHERKPDNPHAQGQPGEYTSWPMLTDRSYSARHLAPASIGYTEQLPKDTPYSPTNVGEVTRLFAREGSMHKSRSSALFMFFAQWFTDSVLRVHPVDRRKNTSNHNIDLCQIYGLTEGTARLLRSKRGGKLRSQIIHGEEYLDYLGELGSDGRWQIKKHYQGLPYAEHIDRMMSSWGEERKHKLYATGLERGNSSIGYVAISTLFMREHNRICDELFNRYSNWDDERLFQTARMINNVILMKLVIVDYINHIAGDRIFSFDPSFAEKQPWYRTPWISLEFDMLYRWHGLVPDKIFVNDTELSHNDYRFNNKLLEDYGFTAIVNSASRNAAGRISLKNVPMFLLGAEYQTIKMGRDFRLASYNDYRQQFGLAPIESFDALTDDRDLCIELKNLYGDIDNLEFIVGLFAEKAEKGRLYGKLMYAMVAYDAFTQIYTNPLLAKAIYTKETFTRYGLDLINSTNSIQALFDRNNQSSIAGMARLGG